MAASRVFLASASLALAFFSTSVLADTVPAGYASSISFASNQFEMPSLSREYYNPLTPDLRVTASATEAGEDAYVFGYFMGLGVIGRDGDPFQIDGRPNLEGAEILWLEFNTRVTIDSVTFSRAGTLPKRDHFRLLVEDDAGSIQEAASGIVPGRNWLDLGTGTLNFADPIAGTRFGFTVLNRADDYVLRRIGVTAGPLPTKAEDVSVVAIPLPAAAWPGLVLLGGLAVVRRIGRRA